MLGGGSMAWARRNQQRAQLALQHQSSASPQDLQGSGENQSQRFRNVLDADSVFDPDSDGSRKCGMDPHDPHQNTVIPPLAL